MLELDFAGWFQCRLATDPDPSDERRGVSGWSFAVGCEPDLDRIIRFQEPLAKRSHAPEVGVTVRAVRVNGTDRLEHPLLGAKVDLLDDPMFEGRNGLIAEDGHEPIHPFDLRITNGSVTLRRKDGLDPAASPLGVSLAQLRRRFGGGFEANEAARSDVAAATEIPDIEAWLWNRIEILEHECQQEDDVDAQAALETRLWALQNPLTEHKIRFALGGRVSYAFAVGEHGGTVEVEDPDRDLGGAPVRDAPWPIKFWMGGWMADALCAFAKGTLTVPFKRPSRR